MIAHENNPKNNEWLVIVNPNAGRKKGEKDWKEIKDLIKKIGIGFKSVFTEHRNHAINITIEYIKKGFRNFIIVGGDGTMNEVVNGIFIQKDIPTTDIILGMIPVGTGNDWGRMYFISKDYKKAVKTISRGNVFLQDAGVVKYHRKGVEKIRYFVNMAGMGYDALVAKKTNVMKEKGGGGPIAYLLNIVLGLFQYKHTFFEIKINDKEVFKGKVFSMSIGICKYNGGGMKQLPNAVPDNGLLDVTLIEETSKFKVIKNIKNLYDGSFIDMPEVKTYIGKTVSIVSRPRNSIYLETDGESLGHSPLNFSIIPKSVKIIVSKKYLKENFIFIGNQTNLRFP